MKRRIGTLCFAIVVSLIVLSVQSDAHAGWGCRGCCGARCYSNSYSCSPCYYYYSCGPCCCGYTDYGHSGCGAPTAAASAEASQSRWEIVDTKRGVLCIDKLSPSNVWLWTDTDPKHPWVRQTMPDDQSNWGR